jgi:hypothetical protein
MAGLPEKILYGVILLPQILVEGPDGLEVVTLNSVELKPVVLRQWS